MSAATTTATATTVRAPAAIGGATVFARTRFIDSQSATADFLAGQGLDCCLSSLGGAHGDKSEAARTSAHAISDKINLGDWPMLLEKILQIIFRCVEGKIPDIQFRIHF